FEIYAKSVSGFDVSDRSKEILVPTLILGSIKDKIIDPAEMILMHEQMPESDLYLYEDYSHAVYDEAPDFKDRIMAFFAA
ncbi:MAG: hypothetical protein IKS69_00880, partial [Erysipelotrichaceae bacterium]|nr:hypothetical protein [Erysipelotrichaceae bacterium]